MLSETEVNTFIQDKYVQQVIGLKPPGLNFHNSNQDTLYKLIKLQISEMAYTCIYKLDASKQDCERLAESPNDQIQDTVKLHHT